ncbi:MAG: 3-dehydroquinate synthase [Nitrospirae bacterium]|nr:3-dehydroquinate synthase [Nitrospirota bacterium]
MLIKVRLGDKAYGIRVKAGLLESPPIPRFLREGRHVLLTNRRVCKLAGQGLLGRLRNAGIRIEAVMMPDGERYKTLATVEKVADALLARGLTRKSSLLAMGGGVVGDVGGFVASTYMRGIRYIQVPTTLLAQVDSSVGGKTGVNLRGGKNMVGTFYQPSEVWTDPTVLGTLPAREYRAGLAEIVKAGIIGDPVLFRFMEGHVKEINARDPQALSVLIARACWVKAKIVMEDEFETAGIREKLNFGHTLAHALETGVGYGRLRHGEAVAIGMAFAMLLSRERAGCPRRDVDRVLALLKSLGLPASWWGYDADSLVRLMKKDKKSAGRDVAEVVCPGIGSVKVDRNVPEAAVRQLLKNPAVHAGFHQAGGGSSHVEH